MAAAPPSGTRDFLGAQARRREHLFARVRQVYEQRGFEPLVTPAFENLDVLVGKYGDEAAKLIFKILRRGEHEHTGEADLALRYDLTVPLARVVATHSGQLPTPYKRYAIGPVWRADRPGRGRFREFTQCDIDIVGSSSPLADAEALCAVGAALDAIGVADWSVAVNSRAALSALLEVYQVPASIAGGVLTSLDKLDKLEAGQVIAELREHGLEQATAAAVVDDITATDAVERIRRLLGTTETGRVGLGEVDRLVELASAQIDPSQIRFSPQLVRGLDYYTGPIYEVTAPGYTGSIASGGRYDDLVSSLGGPDTPACGGSVGLERILSGLDDAEGIDSEIDVAFTVLDDDAAVEMSGLAGRVRAAGYGAELFLGESRKLAKQLKWASGRGARLAVIYGADERRDATVTVRDMAGASQIGLAQDTAVGQIIEMLRGSAGQQS